MYHTMQQNANTTSPRSLKPRPNKLTPKYPFDKEGSYATSSTASVDETGSVQSETKNMSPVTRKLVMTIATPSKTRSKLTDNGELCKLQNEGSFKVDDDSNWWQSPKVSADDALLHDDAEQAKDAPDVPQLYGLTEGETPEKPEEKTLEKKKKVKRISMIKVKASDMAGLSTHQFQKTGNFEADQKELQKIVTKLKADKAARERSGKSEEATTSTTSKPRSQSKMRTRHQGESENSSGAHQRSKSTGRRESEAEMVDLTTPEMRSKSVARRSRSVARKEADSDGPSDPKSDETKKSSSRGRSIGAKRITGTSGNAVTNGKVRERSRSVARQRISDVDNYDADGDDDAADQLQRRKHNIVDLATGLAFVDKDTRSRSVARKRPGEEDVNATEDVHTLTGSSKSLGSRSKSSMRSRESEKEKLRSKSTGRKVRSSEETSSQQSSNKGDSVTIGSDKEKRRSKSVGRALKNIVDNVSSDKVEGNSGSGSKGTSDSQDPKSTGTSTGKSIPWNEFLKHAQSG